MKKAFLLILTPWFLSLIAIILIALIIWFIGPLIAIAEYKPLNSETVRLSFIFMLLIGWGLNNLRENKKSKNEKQQATQEIIEKNTAISKNTKNPDEAILAQRFNDAIKTLQSGGYGQGKLYQLPWYIVIGLPGSGKTTALKNSGLQFPLQNKFGGDPIQGTGGTRYCDWWFTNEAIMIDTAGRYTSQEGIGNTEKDSWIGFLNTLKKGRPKRPLNGIILAISLEDILNKTNTQKSLHATAIKQRIQELNHHLTMELPVYVIFTKMDTIAGFTSFFNDMEKEDREQIWGFNFSKKAIEKEHDFKNYFNNEYQKLIGTISNRVLYLLNQEKTPSKRNLIHQFPYQMNTLKPYLQDFLNNIFTPNQFETPLIIRGLYFISSTQSAMSSQWVSTSIPEQQINSPAVNIKNEYKSFFIKKLLTDIIFKEANLAKINSKYRKRFQWYYWSLIGTCVITFFSMLFIWHNSASLNKDYIAQLQKEVNNYLSATDGGLIDARNWSSLAVGLNHLSNLTTGFSQGSENYSIQQGAGLYQGHKLGSEASNTYKKSLHAFLMKDIEELLSKQLSTMGNDERLYESLKFYLMFYKPEKMQKQTFLIWVDILLKQEIAGDQNKKLRDNIIKHLNTALDENISPPPINQTLVDQARELLVLTPLELRLYRRLKNDYHQENPDEFRLTDIIGKKSDYIFYRKSGLPLTSGIPKLFTYSGFHSGYNLQNKKLAQRLSNEQWIYGDNPDIALTDAEIKTITDRVDNYYFEEYIKHWRSLLQDIRIKPFSSINQGQAVLRLLTAADRPLIKTIAAIRKNTALTEAPIMSNEKKEAVDKLTESFASSEKTRLERLTPVIASYEHVKLPGHKIDDAFKDFNQYAQMDEGLPLSQLQQAIDNLNNHFNKLSNANNIEEAVFAAGVNTGNALDPIVIVKRTANEAHPDIRLWFSDVANNATTVTAAATKGHVNNTWKTQVVRYYEKAIAGRYPIVSTSEKDIKLRDFSTFFGPSGILQTYFDENLNHLVDKTRSNWRWKKNIGIAESRLELFQQAEVIQKIFFQKKSSSPEVSFLLKPVSLDKITTGIRLETGGQYINYHHGPLRSKKLIWPGDTTANSKITFTLASKGTPISSSAEGEWSWFRLLDKHAVLSQQTASDNLKLSFTVNNIKADYELLPHNTFNPFTITAINNFKIPDKL
ncbi:MAG: type VI secretion system membrane subunit TssM [Cellvibrionaceae bacterium]|nr:type VI secretion system membrane subunit TssM [Cellvibrionaceae bacterium]